MFNPETNQTKVLTSHYPKQLVLFVYIFKAKKNGLDTTLTPAVNGVFELLIEKKDMLLDFEKLESYWE